MTARRPRRNSLLSFAALASPVVITIGAGACKTESPPTSVCNVVCDMTSTEAITEPASTGPEPMVTTSSSETSGEDPSTGSTGTGTTTPTEATDTTDPTDTTDTGTTDASTDTGTTDATGTTDTTGTGSSGP